MSSCAGLGAPSVDPDLGCVKNCDSCGELRAPSADPDPGCAKNYAALLALSVNSCAQLLL